jgi:gluconolactonase
VADAEVVATGLEVPEGPVMLPDGRVAFVEQIRGRVSAFGPDGVTTISEAPGSPNAVTLGDDGHLYAAQNGGVVGDWRSGRPTAPAIERITLSGQVTTIATVIDGHRLAAPNDLVFGPDGRLWFTDPGEGYDPDHRRVNSRLFALGPAGGELVLEVEPAYTNGLAFLPDGRLVWVETYDRLVCLLEEGHRRVLCQLPEEHIPDGLDAAADGRLFITTVASHGVTVLAPDGKILDHLLLDDGALPTNCCFDGSALWVTDFGVGWTDGSGSGRLWRVETDATGAPRHPGHL